MNVLAYTMVFCTGSLAIGKLVAPYDPTYALPIWVYYGSVAVEFAICGLLVLKRIRCASIVGLCFFATAIVASWLIKGNCGCTGKLLAIESREIRVLLASIGAAGFAWLLSLDKQRQDGGQKQ